MFFLGSFLKIFFVDYMVLVFCWISFIGFFVYGLNNELGMVNIFFFCFSVWYVVISELFFFLFCMIIMFLFNLLMIWFFIGKCYFWGLVLGGCFDRRIWCLVIWFVNWRFFWGYMCWNLFVMMLIVCFFVLIFVVWDILFILDVSLLIII